MKFERNELCHCGSGIKFKNCCLNKQVVSDSKIEMSTDSILSAVKFGLESLDKLSNNAEKGVKVKEVKLMNGGNTILCDFYPNSTQSFDVKVEVYTIMSFFSGLFKDDLFKGIELDYFGARAFDSSDKEILYAISSRKIVDPLGKGDSIQWMKSTYFQVNTSDFRLSRAKTLISDIENALRKVVVDIYKTKYGNNWWDLAIESKVGESVKRTYENQFGNFISDGDILVNYTYTLDLKKIVSADWGSFKHLFDRKNQFEDIMFELNVLRREEAHNREITEENLMDLERIYDSLLSKIANDYPEIDFNFLVENWKSQLKEIMFYSFKPTYTFDEFNSMNDTGKLNLIIKDCNLQIEYLEKIIEKLKSLKPPISKKLKHEDMVKLLAEYKNLQEEKKSCAENMELDKAKEIVYAIAVQAKKMDLFSSNFLLSEG